jgi:hypothetical protein
VNLGRSKSKVMVHISGLRLYGQRLVLSMPNNNFCVVVSHRWVHLLVVILLAPSEVMQLAPSAVVLVAPSEVAL